MAAAVSGVPLQSSSPARELTLSAQQGGSQTQGDRAKPEEGTEAEKQSRVAALLERLHAKHNALRPWQETSKVVRQAMEKRGAINVTGHQLLLNCLETLQRALKVSSLPSMTDRLESIARQHMLSSHLSPSGTECYITSDLFYVEVHLDTAGQLVDVKVAHHGENPASCPELIQHLSEKNFEEFSKHLKGLVNLYKLPGDNKMKTKMYLALQSLELDLTKMMHMFRLATNANAVETILHGSVGLLTPRSGGNLVSLQCYVSPYDIFEEGTGTQLNIIDANVPRSLGVSVSVTVEGTTPIYKLPIAPLITGSHPVDNKGTPSFSSVTNSNCVDLPACFFLKMNRPMPFSLSFIQRMASATGISVLESSPGLTSLYQLIVQSQLQLLEEGRSLTQPSHNMHFYSSLPDQQHCYFLNGDAPVQEGRSLQGALVTKIPFRHPAQVPALLDIIRHQAAYNTLIGSCVKRTCVKEDSAGLLQFEVCPLTHSSFSVSFQHPVNESLVCVVMEVVDSRQVACKLYKGLSDALICTDDFITKVVQRCMSIPVTMRAIRRKAETIQADTPALSLIAETVEIMVKNNLPPSGSPSYNMATGADGTNPMGLPGLSGGNTPTGGGPPGGPNFAGPISTLFGMNRGQAQGGECLGQGGPSGQSQMQQQQQQQQQQGHSDDYSKVTQNPILTSLLQITGSVGSSPSSQNAPQPHQTPPTTSSPASNTKNHPMLMNLLKDNPTQDFASLYGSSPLERQNSSSGSPRMDGMGGACPGSGTKGKKKRPRGTEKGGAMLGAPGMGMKGLPMHHHQHPATHEDDFQRELFSMDVDAPQNPIFDVSLPGDGLDTPHSITPAPSQCGTPPPGPGVPYHTQSHVQPQQQQQQQQQQVPLPPRMVRLSSSDSIGADITEILSDLPEQTGKAPGGGHMGQHHVGSAGGDDGGPLGTPIRDSSSSGQGSAVFDSADIFNANSNENLFTDGADLIAEAANAAAATPTSDSSSTNFFPDTSDFNPDLLTSSHSFSQSYFDDSSPSADGDIDLVKSFGGSSQQNTPSGTPQNPAPHGQSTPEPSLKDAFDMSIVFGGGGGKPLLGQAPDLGEVHSSHHGVGGQSPVMMGPGGALVDFKSAEAKVKQQQGLMRPKDESGGGGTGTGMGLGGGGSSDGKQAKRSRTPSSEGKSKDKPPKRKKPDTDGKSPSHSSGGRPYTPPGGGSGGSMSGGSKSPGNSGHSQTPPGGATPPIPKITIQIPKGTLSGGKTSSHGGYTSSSSAASNTGGTGGISSSKSHHSHSSSSSGKIKAKEGSLSQGSGSKPGSVGVGPGSGQSQSKVSSQGMGLGKPGSSPITKHGLSGPGGSGGGSSSKMKPQGGKPPGSLMNPSIKPNISPSHSRAGSSADKLSSPMIMQKMQQSQVPGTPPSSKAKSPMGSGGGMSSGGSKSSSCGGMSSQKPMGGGSSSGSASSTSSSGSMSFSGGSQSQYGIGGGGGGSGGGGGGGGGSAGGGNSCGGSGGGQNNANNPNAKGKSPSRNKKPSLTAVIDKLKSVGGGGVGEDGCEVGPPPGPGGGGGGGGGGLGPGPGNMPGNGAPNMGTSKHAMSSQSGEYKREKSDKEAKAKVSGLAGNSADKKSMEPKTGGVSTSGLAKIIISKPDGGSPSIKAKVSLQKAGEGAQLAGLKASPLFSGSTPKHDRSSPSHSRSPGYTPLTQDSESESGSSSVAEKSHQNSPSSDDDQSVRPLPPQDYMSSMGSGEKHKKHKKEKKKQKERERERDREREKEKKKAAMSMSQALKADSWSRSPISASDSSLSMLGSERSSRPSPVYMRNDDDDLMDSALTGNL